MAPEGADLNPLLQDPGLIIHPPLLYMGYVGLVVPFAFAIAALLGGKLDAAWAMVAPWTNVAWAFLTFGIMLGVGGHTTNLDGAVGGSGIRLKMPHLCPGSWVQH